MQFRSDQMTVGCKKKHCGKGEANTNKEGGEVRRRVKGNQDEHENKEEWGFENLQSNSIGSSSAGYSYWAGF